MAWKFSIGERVYVGARGVIGKVVNCAPGWKYKVPGGWIRIEPMYKVDTGEDAFWTYARYMEKLPAEDLIHAFKCSRK